MIVAKLGGYAKPPKNWQNIKSDFLSPIAHCMIFPNGQPLTKGGEVMKKAAVWSLVTSVFLLLSYGCATRDYVRQQQTPLVDRISKLEERLSSLEARSGEVEALSAEQRQLKQEANQAKALAEEAMQTAKECCSESAGAVQRAEEAAKRAEAAAAKAEKAFELQQRK
jgi:hypothetical protein